MTGAAKALQFPLAGIARDLDYRKAYIPSEGVAFATPFAANVTGECTFGERKRGGSRPGLKLYGGVTESSSGAWGWPGGDRMLWSGAETKAVVFSKDRTIAAPDGSLIFDPHATFSVAAAKGNAPSDATAMAKYRARLVLAKGSMWYASRQGDFTDFDYGGDGGDTGRAVAGNTANADAAGEDITALAAINDIYLVVATNRSMRILAGEPTEGEWSVVSDYTGVVGRDAWCWDGTTFWFVGKNGMYALVPGENVAKRASGRLPEDFKGLSSVTLAYDAERNGVHVIASKDGSASDWFYDIAEQAFWKMEYPAAKRPVVAALVDAYGTGAAAHKGVNRIVFKCADGLWRIPDDETDADEGATAAEDAPIASKVAIGPLRASLRDDADGMLAELSATLAEGSAAVTVEVYAAKSPEKAVALAKAGTSPKASFALEGGWNAVWRPRVRGAWVIFVLKSNGRWAYESMTAACKMLGRLR